jgi:hypothetical protein
MGTNEFSCKPVSVTGNPADTYNEPSDNVFNNGRYGRNDSISACSYLYEFNAAPCSWYNSGAGFTAVDLNNNGTLSWGEVKQAQLLTGNGGGPFAETLFPIIRCYHHSHERQVLSVNPQNPSERRMEGVTIDVAYAGNVFEGPLYWEWTPPGGH